MWVFVCSFRPVPCTAWLGMRCRGVCLGLCYSRAPPLLAGVLGCVCVCVRAPLVPSHSCPGCAVWACVAGSGFGCALPLLVGVLGCVCVRACALLAPRRSWRAGVCVRGFGLCPLSGFPGFLAWVLGRPASCVRRVCFPSTSGGPPVAWGCAGVAVGGVCPPPLPFHFFLFGEGGRRGVSCRGFFVSVAGCPGLGSGGCRPPLPSLSGCAFVCCLFFFFRLRPGVVCVGVFGVSLPPMGPCTRFRVAGLGWPVLGCPFRGSRLW